MRLSIAVVMLVVLFSAVGYAADVRSASVSGNDLTVTLSLAKSVYVEGEPIIATLSLKNTADRIRKLAEPSWRFNSAGYIVAPESEDIKMPTMMQDSKLPPPEDFAWDFKAGETRSDDMDLLARYNGPLPPGKYSVYGTYNASEYMKLAEKSLLKTGKVYFTVVAAKGSDAKIAQMFSDARRKVWFGDKNDALKAAGDMKKVKDSKKKPFAEYAGFFEAEAQRTAGNPVEYHLRMTEYIAQHGKVPHYGRLALTSLLLNHIKEGRLNQACELASTLPEGYERGYWLKQCKSGK